MQIAQLVFAVAALATTAFAGPVATASSTDSVASQQCINDAMGLVQVYSGCKIDTLAPPASFTKDQQVCLCSTANQNIFIKIANSCNGPNDSNTLAGIKNMQTACQQIKSNAFTSSVSIGVAAAVAAMVL